MRVVEARVFQMAELGEAPRPPPGKHCFRRLFSLPTVKDIAAISNVDTINVHHMQITVNYNETTRPNPDDSKSSFVAFPFVFIIMQMCQFRLQ
jgi:hypothetical protein